MEWSNNMFNECCDLWLIKSKFVNDSVDVFISQMFNNNINGDY